MRNLTNTAVATITADTGVQMLSLATGEQHGSLPANRFLAQWTDVAAAPAPTGNAPGPRWEKLADGSMYLVDRDGRAEKIEFKQALDVNLTPVAYVPTATGNAANLGQVVIDSNGDVWAIDLEGDAIRLEWANDLNVLTSVQPTPTATGNTTNLMTVFKDASGVTWIVDRNGDAIAAGAPENVAYQTNSATFPAVALAGDELFVTADGTSAGEVLEQWIYNGTAWQLRPRVQELDVLTTVQPTPTATGNTTNLNTSFKDANGVTWIVDKNGDAIATGAPENVFYQADSTTFPALALAGDELFVTDDGTDDGKVLEQWIYNGTNWQLRPQAEPVPMAGSILAAIACVGSPVLVPTGNKQDMQTVGAGGDHANLVAAMASPAVVSGTILQVQADQVLSATLDVNKSVVIDLSGFSVSSTTAGPVTMFNMVAPLSVVTNGVINHLKTTNTSVETVFNLNSTNPTQPVFVTNNIINVQEFGVIARGNYVVANNTFGYIGASLTNSHRFIALYGNSGESKITGNKFTATTAATTRYSNFILMGSVAGTVYTGQLYVDNNTQTGGSLRQFLFHEAGVPTGLELYVANNTFDDLNGGIGILSPALYNGYAKIGVYGNTQGASAAGNFKGVFFVDGTGALSDTVALTYGSNVTTAGALRADYVSLDADSTNLIAVKNTVTFTEQATAPVVDEETLGALGDLLQDLKGRKTFIVDSEGESVGGNGTEDDPFVIPTAGAPVTVGTNPPTGTSIEGAIHLVTDDGLPTGTVLEQYIFDKDSGVWIEMQRNAQNTLKFGTASPTAPGEWDGEEFFVTSDGTSTGTVAEQWIWDKQSSTWIERPSGGSASTLETTSLTPVVYNGSAYVGAQTDTEIKAADLLLLSDGTRAHDGKITWTGHGLTVGSWYYTSQTTAGAYTATKPTSGWVQQLFFVEDANTIHVDIEEAWNATPTPAVPVFEPSKIVYVNATSPTTATIFDLANPPVTNDNALKNDSQNLYIGSNGSTWTSNGTVYSTYVYPATVKHMVHVRKSTTQAIAGNGLTVVTGWDAPTTNTAGAAAFNPATGVFTAQRAGYYMLNARLSYDVNQAWSPLGGGRGVRILINGTGVGTSIVNNQTTFVSPGNEQTGTVVAGPRYLAAGATVSVDTFHNEGTVRNLAPGGGLNQLSIWEI